MDKVLQLLASGAKLIIALGLAYFAALWFALIVWTYRDVEQRTRSVITQIFATLLSVLFFVPGALLYLVLRPRETLDETFQRSLEEEYLLQDLEDLPRCHSCHRAIESDWVICPSCHTELRHECPTCAHLVRVTWDICPYCATELEPAASAAAEESSIGRLMATIRERIGNHPPLEGGPGEPVYANPPPQSQAPMPVPIQHYQQNGHQQPQGPFPPARRYNPADANRADLLPARPVAPAPADPYNGDMPVEFGDEGAARRGDPGRSAANGQRAENNRNGYAPNGNGYPPTPRDGTNDEAIAQRGRPSS